LPLSNSTIEDRRVCINLVLRWSKRWLAFDRSNFSNVIGTSQNIAIIQKDTRRYRRYETRLCTVHANKTRFRESKQKQRCAGTREIINSTQLFSRINKYTICGYGAFFRPVCARRSRGKARNELRTGPGDISVTCDGAGVAMPASNCFLLDGRCPLNSLEEFAAVRLPPLFDCSAVILSCRQRTFSFRLSLCWTAQTLLRKYFSP